MDLFITIWVLIVVAVVLNGFAAGVVAVFHAWRRSQSRRSRVLAAAAISSVVSVVMLAPVLFQEVSIGTSSVADAAVAFAVIGGLALAVSLPGAMILARKLEGPGEAYRTFE